MDYVNYTKLIIFLVVLNYNGITTIERDLKMTILIMYRESLSIIFYTVQLHTLNLGLLKCLASDIASQIILQISFWCIFKIAVVSIVIK